MTKLKNKWIKIWKKGLVGQEDSSNIIFYNFVGTILDKINVGVDPKYEELEDIRLHTMIISRTTTGKDEMYIIIDSLFNQLNEGVGGIEIKHEKSNDCTDAALIGSVDELKFNFNKKKGLVEGMEGYMPPIKYGLWHKINHFTSTEASDFFNSGKHNEKLHKHTCELTDRKREVRKDLGQQHNIAGKCDVSLLLTVQPGKIKGINELIYSGFFGRFMINHKYMSRNFHNAIMNKSIENTFSSSKPNPFYTNLRDDSDIKEFISGMKDIISFYKSNIKNIKIHPVTEMYVKQKIKEVENTYSNLLVIDIELLDDYLRRTPNYVKRIARINAVVNKRNVILREDIDEAVILLKNTIESIKYFIINTSMDEKAIIAVVRGLKKKNTLNKGDIITILSLYMGVGRNKAGSIFNNINWVKHLNEIKDGKETKYTLIDGVGDQYL